MRIGFDAKRLYHNHTGLGNYSRATIDVLRAYYPDLELLLYTPRLAEGSPYDDLARLPRSWMGGSLWRTIGMAADTRRDGIDLFHGLSNELPVGLTVPSVVTIHDVAFRRFTDMYHAHDRLIYDLKWRYALRHATRVIAISEATRRDIIDIYGVEEERIDVVYQPVALPFYDEPHRHTPQEPFMLYVGSINSRKNLLGAVQALELLPSDLRLPLVVVGGGREYKSEVMRYVAAHGLEQWVRFPTRRVSDDELRRLYLSAEVFVYPSFFEGFGLPVVEALLTRCPVVTSNVSSLPEAGGSYARLADPSDPASISHLISEALTESDADRAPHPCRPPVCPRPFPPARLRPPTH